MKYESTHKERVMGSPAKDLPVIVVGGGIGGLAAALALVRQGLKVTVL